MSRFPTLAVLLVACGPDPAPSGGGSSKSVGEALSCELQEENALRFDCVVTLDAPGPLDVLMMSDELIERRFASDESVEEHALTLWGLRAEQTYTARFVPRGDPDAAWDEQLTTGEVPREARLTTTRVGTPTTDAVLFPFQCGGPGHLVLVDAATGELLWYQDITEGGALSEFVKVDGFEYDPERETIVALAAHVALREFDWSGRVLLDLEAEDLGRPVHHDVHSAGELTYTLNAGAHEEEDGVYVFDGVYVLGPGGDVVAEWDLRDHLEPVAGGMPGGYWSLEFPGAIDYSHTNGLFVDSGGDWILSSRALQTVFEVRGDPDAPDFGEIQWALTTDPAAPLGSDFEVVSSTGVDDLSFSDQHHANVDDRGRLLMFDNGTAAEHSRAVEIVLDEAAGVADVTESWELHEHCPIQGGTFRLPSGNVLVTCATSRSFHEFEPGFPDPVFTMTADCADTDDRPLAIRGQPVSLD